MAEIFYDYILDELRLKDVPDGSGGFYGSFYDTTTHTVASTTTAYPITLNTTISNNGVSIGSPTSRIVFDYAGIYSITFSVQYENTDNQAHASTIWLRKNGTDVPDSSSYISVPSSHGQTNGKILTTVNYVLDLNANDYIEVYFQAENTDIQIATIPAGTTPTTPVSPSIILTAVQGGIIQGGGGIQDLNGETGSTQTFATSTTGTDFTITSASDTHTFNIPTASATNRGLLSSTDWNTFNNKVTPNNYNAVSNEFLTAYNSTNGNFTGARPTWANIDKTTSNISDITTRSHTSLTDIGTNTHPDIDIALTRLANTSGTNTGDVTVTDSSTIDFTLTGQALTGSVIPAGINHNDLGSKQGGTTGEYNHLTNAQVTNLNNQSGTNTGDETKTSIETKLGVATSTNSGYLSSTDWSTFNGKLTPNSPITGATKTKITYDANGLVTAGADATTADITDSTNKRYVTDAQQTVLTNTSGTNTGDITVTDSSTIDFTLTGQALTGSVIQSGITHNNLGGLTTGDPHTQYAYLDGRVGGQNLTGGTGVNEQLFFQANTATSNSLTADAFSWRTGNNGANTRMVLRQDGSLGVNNTSPNAGLHVTTGLTAVSGYNNGMQVSYNINKTTGDAIGAFFDVTEVAGGAKTTYAHRARVVFPAFPAATLQGLQATSNQIIVSGGNTVSFLEVLTSNLEVLDTATVSEARLIRLFTPTKAVGATIGTLIGLQIPNLTQGTTNWSIYSEGGDMYHAGQIQAGVGSVTAPGFSFTTETNTGMYSRVAGELNFTTAGSEELRITGSQILNVNTGTAASPAWSFNADPDVGIYRSGTNQLSIATAGVEAIRVLAAQGVQLRVFAGGGTTGASIDNAGGIIRTTSDERLKKDITPITGALEKVRNITGIYYNWINEEEMGNNTHIGFTAQDLLPEIPEVVFEDPSTGFYGVNYSEITALLTEAIKEQQVIIDTLKSEVEILKGQINGQ